jgi:hypothetical protein
VRRAVIERFRKARPTLLLKPLPQNEMKGHQMSGPGMANCHYQRLAIPRGGPESSAWRKRERFFSKERFLPLNLQIDEKIFYVLSISGRPRDLLPERERRRQNKCNISC